MVKLMVDEVKASTVIEKGPLPRHQKRGKIWPSLKGGGGSRCLKQRVLTRMTCLPPSRVLLDVMTKKNPKGNRGMTILN